MYVLSNKLAENGHEMQVRIYHEDTDFSGIVYHANYLKYMERSRTEWIRHLGILHQDMGKKNYAFAVRKIALTFNLPAVMDDLLIIRSIPKKLGGARVFIHQKVLRKEESGDEVELCRADVELAFVNRGGGARLLPDDLRDRLEGKK